MSSPAVVRGPIDAGALRCDGAAGVRARSRGPIRRSHARRFNLEQEAGARGVQASGRGRSAFPSRCWMA